jgi:hypothetical protein
LAFFFKKKKFDLGKSWTITDEYHNIPQELTFLLTRWEKSNKLKNVNKMDHYRRMLRWQKVFLGIFFLLNLIWA